MRFALAIVIGLMACPALADDMPSPAQIQAQLPYPGSTRNYNGRLYVLQSINVRAGRGKGEYVITIRVR